MRCCAIVSRVVCKPEQTARLQPDATQAYAALRTVRWKSDEGIRKRTGESRQHSGERPTRAIGMGACSRNLALDGWRPGGTFPPRGKGVACRPRTRPDDIGSERSKAVS